MRMRIHLSLSLWICRVKLYSVQYMYIFIYTHVHVHHGSQTFQNLGAFYCSICAFMRCIGWAHGGFVLMRGGGVEGGSRNLTTGTAQEKSSDHLGPSYCNCTPTFQSPVSSAKSSPLQFSSTSLQVFQGHVIYVFRQETSFQCQHNIPQHVKIHISAAFNPAG